MTLKSGKSYIQPLATNFQYDLLAVVIVEFLTIVNMVSRASEFLTVNNQLITLLEIRC